MKNSLQMTGEWRVYDQPPWRCSEKIDTVAQRAFLVRDTILGHRADLDSFGRRFDLHAAEQ
jgi:hypothetical protein